MKKLTRLMALVLSLILTVSLLSVTAMATNNGTTLDSSSSTIGGGNSGGDSTGGSNGGSNDDSSASGDDQPVTTTITCQAVHFADSSMKDVLYVYDATFKVTADFAVNSEIFGYFPNIYGRVFEFAGVSQVEVKHDGGKHQVQCYYVPHAHSYRIGYNRTHHWEACRCGSTLMYETHVDPAKDEDSICTCGYKFSSDASLVTLNLSGMVFQDRFNKEQTEYVADVHTYKPITSTEVKYRTNDIYATVDAPTTVAIEEGMNVIEVKVTAEDKKTVRTYTVFASLGSKVDGVLIGNTASTTGERATVINHQAATKRSTATLAISDAMGEKLALQASSNESKRIIIEPIYSKWSIKTVNVPMSAAVLEKLSETEADLVIKTFSGSIVIPNAEMDGIAKEGANLVFSLAKTEGDEVVMTLTADEKEVNSANITLESAEK